MEHNNCGGVTKKKDVGWELGKILRRPLIRTASTSTRMKTSPTMDRNPQSDTRRGFVMTQPSECHLIAHVNVQLSHSQPANPIQFLHGALSPCRPTPSPQKREGNPASPGRFLPPKSRQSFSYRFLSFYSYPFLKIKNHLEIFRRRPMRTLTTLTLALFWCFGVASGHAILENYERKLNKILQTSGTRTVKRYKCVEEYVTLDDDGVTVDSRRGAPFLTSRFPGGKLTQTTKPEHEYATSSIRRKPSKRTKPSKRRKYKASEVLPIDMIPSTSSSTTTTTTTTEEPTTSPTTSVPFEELDDADADRLIEQLYLNNVNDVPQTADVPPTYSTISEKTTATEPPKSALNPLKPQKVKKLHPEIRRAPPSTLSSAADSRDADDIEQDDEDSYERTKPKRVFPMSNAISDDEAYDYYEDVMYYRRPMSRRAYPPRLRRRRPLIIGDSSSDADKHNHVTHDLHPLRPMKRLRHQRRIKPYRPRSHDAAPITTTDMYPPPIPQTPPASQALPPISDAAPVQEMQEATPESCAKIGVLAKRFGITDVSTWARSNCSFLQMYAPNASCALIYHFIDSCHQKKFI
ncbi:unnamed protein product [Caenorhabditis auriculariae]|uniref:aECM cysteine-cradle domain-containing protein n=1 Tax=Caenorhabditis auriculariae TaxID=2777116 RepID=A0A8S1HG99_9PELO|nr:unnamed protein product [Caenorhabditis auriculariae]